MSNLDLRNDTSISPDENKKNNQIWLERERLAQIEFKAKKQLEEREQARRRRKVR